MSGNPNMQKIGKRKTPGGQKQPDWLFPSKDTAMATPKSQPEDQHNNKKDKQLAKDLLKRREAGDPPKSAPPAQLLKLVSSFLAEYEFTSAAQALETESKSNDTSADISEKIPSLDTIYTEWRNLKGQNNGISADTAAVKVKSASKKQKSANHKSDTSSSDESSDDSDIEMRDSLVPLIVRDSSSDASSVSSSSSDSESDGEDVPPAKGQSSKSKVNGLKRKAASSSESSSDSDSSSEEDKPKIKKLKTESSSASSGSDSSSEEDSSSDSSSNSSSAGKPTKKMKNLTMKGSSSEKETSSSDSDSDSDSSVNSMALKTPLPDSDSDSSSDSSSTSSSSSDSSSESDSEPLKNDKKKKAKKPVIGSDTSATLSDGPKKLTLSDDSSSDSTSSSDSPRIAKSVELNGSSRENPAAQSKTAKGPIVGTKLSPPLPPDPAAKIPRGGVNKRFSRIPDNIQVDERLQSNAFVPYDYAQKAHEDLIVTKGKGFTKEKNKKKRGSYKGGYIYVEGKKGIKFED
jgi:hypothetical protein